MVRSVEAIHNLSEREFSSLRNIHFLKRTDDYLLSVVT